AVWTYFYRNYLQFMYLNNAYHFYSPDPGPASLLWFAVKYDKGAPRWVMIPARQQFRTRQDYQRFLALCQWTRQSSPGPPAPIFKQLWERRVQAGANQGVPQLPEEVAPRNVQYRQPLPLSQHLLAAYARYVATHAPSNLGPEDKVKSVKVYRVIHNM